MSPMPMTTASVASGKSRRWRLLKRHIEGFSNRRGQEFDVHRLTLSGIHLLKRDVWQESGDAGGAEGARGPVGAFDRHRAREHVEGREATEPMRPAGSLVRQRDLTEHL